jgi:hypothetical protein
MPLTNRALNGVSPKLPPNPASDRVRLRALERLYERKAAVEELIESLEEYQRCCDRQRATCVEFTAAPKYS